MLKRAVEARVLRGQTAPPRLDNAWKDDDDVADDTGVLLTLVEAPRSVMASLAGLMKPTRVPCEAKAAVELNIMMKTAPSEGIWICLVVGGRLGR